MAQEKSWGNNSYLNSMKDGTIEQYLYLLRYLVIYGLVACVLQSGYWILILVAKLVKDREEKKEEEAYNQSLKDLENSRLQI